ncbi:serine/threonine-protein phosphatase with EF-hands 2-like isoform X1 [Limulus polyphemus]|uniref:Serine/threonine-protein phosphatase with EF-hands n=2 Tax=Limulus polyphemus TaxID=6850 RepID=A0ABM1T2T6_LIMPO|nr:serine/threonine-protein phosphatase with EF-hands 2-like isoform X1 [Limulus polyphemus]
MGCAGSAIRYPNSRAVQKFETMSAIERTIKAALLIQRWYRRYRARLEIRRRCYWTIFQSIEYAGEQDQIRLYSFFTDLMTHIACDKSSFSNSIANSLRGRPRILAEIEEEERELWKETNPNLIPIESTYQGPHIHLPLTADQVTLLINSFRKRKLLHAHYVLTLLHEARKILQSKPNINVASTTLSRHITICGDLHGKLDDLLTIFYKNSLPASDNPYIFNGDFVDRGVQSVEVFLLLIACLLVWPDRVFLNRGNHEDFSVNIRYGFIKEIMYKYTRHATRIIQVTEDVYSWLPLATIIDNKVFVVHGGVTDRTDLKKISRMDRHQLITILQPPMIDGKMTCDQEEWDQVVGILWSDPRPQPGCHTNSIRGGGSFFGPDVTEAFLQRYQLERIIRSHECKPDGFEFTHGDRVLTIFSASNYYAEGTNKAAYVKLVGTNLVTQIVMYVSSSHTSNAEIQQRQGYVEQSALRELKQLIYASHLLLIEKFHMEDTEQSGKICIGRWCDIMKEVVGLQLPWRLLCPKIAKLDPLSGNVYYESIFQEYTIQNKLAEQNEPSLLETLYRSKDTLETIFRFIDTDGSGLISMQEFTDACQLLSKHLKTSMHQEEIQDLAKSIDINKDGFIDFNEFLEAFRLVDNDSPSRRSGNHVCGLFCQDER